MNILISIILKDLNEFIIFFSLSTTILTQKALLTFSYFLAEEKPHLQFILLKLMKNYIHNEDEVQMWSIFYHSTRKS